MSQKVVSVDELRNPALSIPRRSSVLAWSIVSVLQLVLFAAAFGILKTYTSVQRGWWESGKQDCSIIGVQSWRLILEYTSQRYYSSCISYVFMQLQLQWRKSLWKTAYFVSRSSNNFQETHILSLWRFYKNEEYTKFQMGWYSLRSWGLGRLGRVCHSDLDGWEITWVLNFKLRISNLTMVPSHNDIGLSPITHSE